MSGGGRSLESRRSFLSCTDQQCVWRELHVEQTNRNLFHLDAIAAVTVSGRMDRSAGFNIGTWMQSVGASWLMTTLTPSAVLVALMQSATSLPILLVGLLAGAIADVVDRRKLLILTQS